MAEKRKREPEDTFSDISSVTQPSSNAKIQGAITDLSSMKKGKMCEYFAGKLADETGNIRIHGFDSSVRQKLYGFQQAQCPVALSGCEIQQSKLRDELEVKVCHYSGIQKADKEVDISTVVNTSPTELAAITKLKVNSRVTVEIKVIGIKDPSETGEGQKIQDTYVADKTGQCRVTMWEDKVGKVEMGKSYRFCGFLVREFRGEKHITTPKEGSCIEVIDDIPNFPIAGLPESKNVTIIGVKEVNRYRSCFECGSRVTVHEGEDDIGHCSKCKMTQRLSETRYVIMAKFIVKTMDGEKIPVCAFGKTLMDIMETNEDVTAELLIKSKPFTMQHTDGTIFYVSHSNTTL